MNYDNLFDFKYNLTIISIKTTIVILFSFLILRLLNILERDYLIISIIVVLITITYITYKYIVRYPQKLYLAHIVLFGFMAFGITGISILTHKFIVLIWLDFLIIASQILSSRKLAFIFFIVIFCIELFLFFDVFKEDDLFNKFTIILSLFFFNILGYLVSIQLEKFAYETEAQKILLEKVTMIDFLTDTYNRRAFFKLSQMMINEAVRENQNIGIIMMDIDFFKRINDTYGHHAGDLVLRDFAGIIKENIRNNDLFARIGGEEFILMIKNVNREKLEKFAQKLMNFIRYTDIIADNKKINITVSMGLYIFNPRYESLEDAMNKADKALYKAKEKRNRFIFYESNLEDLK